jgi:3-hydroxyisobutyrate dehydrogenase
LIGLGLMGSAMSARLLQQGWRVVASNREAPALEAAAAMGAEPVADPRAVAEHADIVLLCVLDTAAVEACVQGPRGILAACGGARLVVDLSTIDPAATRRMAERLRGEKGVGWVDAPVSGGPPAARDGALTIMAGGTEPDYAAALPVLKALGRNCTRMGPVGAGQVTKIINQAIVGAGFVVMAEALHLAEKAGIDAARLPDSLAGGFADGELLRRIYPLMQARAFDPPLGYASQLLKDLKAVARFAGEAGAELPMVRAACARYAAYVAAGHARADSVSIIRQYEAEPHG